MKNANINIFLGFEKAILIIHWLWTKICPYGRAVGNWQQKGQK